MNIHCCSFASESFASRQIKQSKYFAKVGFNFENINQVKYTLGTGDVLDIRVYKSPEFNSNVTVLSDGTINLIRLGPLHLEGLTINQAKKLIEKEYKKGSK